MVTLKFCSLPEVKIGDVIDYRRKTCKRKNLMTVISVKDGVIKLEYERQVYRKSIEERAEITANCEVGRAINMAETDPFRSKILEGFVKGFICGVLWKRKAALERL